MPVASSTLCGLKNGILRSLAVSLIVVGIATLVGATPPVVAPGSCLYLVGAPAGQPLAATEEIQAGDFIQPDCAAVARHVATNEGVANSAEAYLSTPGVAGGHVCRVSSWIGHVFTVADGVRPITGRISMNAQVLGYVRFGGASGNSSASMAVTVGVVEIDPDTAAETLVASSFAEESSIGNDGTLRFDHSFGIRVAATLLPGRTYAARLTLSLVAGGANYDLDFGSLGSGNNVHYDSIEVCLDAPQDDSALMARLDRLEGFDLEHSLYEKECMPTIWMPAAQGGRLEEARALVADRLARAVATGDPIVNARVAQARLNQADASAAAGQYERACRSLVDGLHALTTP